METSMHMHNSNYQLLLNLYNNITFYFKAFRSIKLIFLWKRSFNLTLRAGATNLIVGAWFGLLDVTFCLRFEESGVTDRESGRAFFRSIITFD